VLRPITVDPDFAVDVAPGFAVQLEEVLPEEVLPEVLLELLRPLAVVLLVEPPLHATAKSATAAIAPSADNRRKMKDIRMGPSPTSADPAWVPGPPSLRFTHRWGAGLPFHLFLP